MVLVALVDDSDALLLLGEPGSSSDVGDWVVHVAPGGGVLGGWMLRFPRPQAFFDAWEEDEEAPDESLNHVEVGVELLAAAPAGAPARRFTRVAEVSSLGPAELVGAGGEPEPTARADGSYRLRLSVDDSRLPTRLLIQSWPAPPEAGQVVRGPSARVEEPLPLHPDMFLPEVPAGVAAAARIGNDVDDGPGARTLSGELGVAHARLVLPRSPAWHGDFCLDKAYVLTANPDHSIARNSWTTAPPRGAPHDGWSVCAMKHADQVDHITGWRGAILTQPAPDDDPRRRAHLWRWVRRIPPEASDATAGTMLDPILDTDTLRIVHLNRVPGTPVHTEVVIEHRDVPVEWVDDLRDWWTLQLAIRAARI